MLKYEGQASIQVKNTRKKRNTPLHYSKITLVTLEHFSQMAIILLFQNTSSTENKIDINLHFLLQEYDLEMKVVQNTFSEMFIRSTYLALTRGCFWLTLTCGPSNWSRASATLIVWNTSNTFFAFVLGFSRPNTGCKYLWLKSRNLQLKEWATFKNSHKLTPVMFFLSLAAP